MPTSSKNHCENNNLIAVKMFLTRKTVHKRSLFSNSSGIFIWHLAQTKLKWVPNNFKDFFVKYWKPFKKDIPISSLIDDKVRTKEVKYLSKGVQKVPIRDEKWGPAIWFSAPYSPLPSKNLTNISFLEVGFLHGERRGKWLHNQQKSAYTHTDLSG